VGHHGSESADEPMAPWVDSLFVAAFHPDCIRVRSVDVSKQIGERKRLCLRLYLPYYRLVAKEPSPIHIDEAVEEL
jgi:hypothetical protein